MSNFKKIMEATISGQLNKIAMPTPNLNKRKMSLEEVKALVGEAFEDAKGGYGKVATCRLCGKEFDDQEGLGEHLMKTHKEDDWSHAGQAKPIDWAKELDLKEFLINKSYK